MAVVPLVVVIIRTISGSCTLVVVVRRTISGSCNTSGSDKTDNAIHFYQNVSV